MINLSGRLMMFRFGFYFILITILGFYAQPINGGKIPSQSFRTAVIQTDVTLNCHHPSSEQSVKNVSWFFSSMDQPSIMPMADNMRYAQTKQNNSITIQNVTIDDAGVYFCCLDEPCLDTYLVVLEFNNVLSFAPDVHDSSGEIIVSSKGDFSITAHHGSEVKVEIEKEPSIPICSHFTASTMCYKKKRTNSTSYYLKNAKLQDSGRFVIQSTFMNFESSFSLNIIIQGKPDINMESVQSEEGINFICSGHAYPPPAFEFHFVPVDMGNADSKSPILLESSVTSKNSTRFGATATIRQPLVGPGTVECKASNSEGVSYAVASLFLEHFGNEKRSVSNSTEREQVEFVTISSIGSANDGGTTHFPCNAYFYEFSNYFVVQYKGINLPVEGILSDDAYVAEFTLTASNDPMVVCNVQFKNRTQMNKQNTLPLELGVNDEPKMEYISIQSSKVWSIVVAVSVLNFLIGLVFGNWILNRWKRSKSKEQLLL